MSFSGTRTIYIQNFTQISPVLSEPIQTNNQSVPLYNISIGNNFLKQFLQYNSNILLFESNIAIYSFPTMSKWQRI